jgi:hypothetical protein
MASVTFAIDEKLKAKLSKFIWVVWSELVRQELLKRSKRAMLFRELEELTKDSKLTDEDCIRFAKLVKERFAKESRGE